MASDHIPGFYVDALEKYRQKHKVKVEFRELSRTGPPHDLRFTFQVTIDGKTFPKAEGKSKKEARDAAAKLALEKCEENKEVSSLSLLTTDTSDNLPLGNYIGEINRLIQVEKLPVSYQQGELSTESPERFFCKYLIGEKEYGSAIGSTKQKAKHLAAKRTYEKLLEEKPSMKDDSASLGPSPAESSDHDSSSSMSFGSASPSENGFSESGSERNDISASSTHTPSPASTTFRSSLGKVKTRLAPHFDSPYAVTNYPTKNERFMKDFSDIEEIDKGGYGCVFKATHNIDGKTYVIKRVEYGKEDKEKVKREVIVLAKLDHPNIVRYCHCWHGEDYVSVDSYNKSLSTVCLFIQMEFCDKGTLETWIDNRRGKDPDKQLSLKLFEQIVEGVKYIHSKALIHRDLKPSNIFLVGVNQIKIGDFGLVTFQDYEEKRTRDKGTPQYMSPEQLSSPEEYGNEVDIFALGLILAELLYISTTRYETCKIFKDLRNGHVPDMFDDKERSLLHKLVSTEPKKRPSASEIQKTLERWKNVPERRMRNTC
nr:protein kinase R [Noctilio albiventris]